jgi:hypothetical protein
MPPTRPRWAKAPQALSAGAEIDQPDIDCEAELFEGEDGQWIEIMKGSDGRIAVKSDSTHYNIMVWLPGFS